MTLDELRALKPQIMEIAATYGVTSISVFGSVARGDADENSDVDLMIDTFNGSFLKFATLKGQLEDVIGNKVDIRKPENIRHPLVRSAILHDVVAL